MKAIETKDLFKRFEDVEAVKGINLEIEEGELFGLLGPNGAGKTTTISMLCTIVKPTSGSASVFGHDVKKESSTVRGMIGIVFQDPSLDDNLTGKENLDFHGRLYKVPRNEIAGRISEVLELVELADKANVIVKKYSGGMKRRLEIARGLLHHPKVLFLDEPTLGLDPQTRRHIWEYIEKLNREKKITMILTTHYMDEAERLCDRLAIIDHGQVIAEGTPSDLIDRLGGHHVVEFEASGNPGDGTALDTWRALPGVESVRHDDGLVSLTVREPHLTIPALLDAVEKQGSQLLHLTTRQASLEDVFVNLTGRHLREE